MARSENIDPKMITTYDLTNAQVREIEFVELFSESIKKLMEALGVTRKIAKQAGTVLKTYKATGNLENGAVPEGEVIPLSKYTVSPSTYKEIKLKKWRKQTTAEAITDYGYNQAVDMTTDRMLKDVQKGIRSDFFYFLENETGTTPVTGIGLQDAFAKAWANLQIKFEDDDVQTVFFCNPLDVSDYLATANITVQNDFGMTYVNDFLGIGTLIMNSSVAKGSFYATAMENLVLYYIPVNGADLNEVFDFIVDETGYVGIHEAPDYNNMTAIDTVVSGIELFAERTDGVVKGTITGTITEEEAQG